MLILRLQHPVSRQVLDLGPEPYFRIAGGSLRAGPSDVELGVYRQGLWAVAGDHFLTIETRSPTQVRFEEHGQSCAGAHGPFDCIHIIDGAIRHGPGSSRLLARFVEDLQAWYVYPDQKNCPTVFLLP